MEMEGKGQSCGTLKKQDKCQSFIQLETNGGDIEDIESF